VILLPHMPLDFLALATEGPKAPELADAPFPLSALSYLRIAPRTAPARGKAAALFARAGAVRGRTWPPR
jgi:hypothetical protein